ncbi:hypothetical protein [Dyella psychrodurans]|nr:hypothetical protein [Dyella psychrodurans]
MGLVCRIISKAGVAEGRKRIGDPAAAARNAQIVARYRDGATYKDIAAEFQRPIGSVRGVITTAGAVQERARSRQPDPKIATRNAQIDARYLEGETMQSIAAGFRPRYWVVNAIITKAGVARPKGPRPDSAIAARNAQIVARYQAGASYKDIAEAFHLPFGTVSAIISSAGAVQGRRRGPRTTSAARSVPHPGRRSAPQTKRATSTPIMDRYLAGETCDSIAADVGISSLGVHQVLMGLSPEPDNHLKGGRLTHVRSTSRSSHRETQRRWSA